MSKNVACCDVNWLAFCLDEDNGNEEDMLRVKIQSVTRLCQPNVFERENECTIKNDGGGGGGCGAGHQTSATLLHFPSLNIVLIIF